MVSNGYTVYLPIFKRVFTTFPKSIFIIMNVYYYVNFNGNFKYFDHFENKLNLAYMQLWLVINAISKNPISVIQDILTIFYFCKAIIGSFRKEFKYIHHLLYNYLKYLLLVAKSSINCSQNKSFIQKKDFFQIKIKYQKS